MSFADWLQAIRVKTLGACIGPCLVGSGLALAGGGATAWVPLLCCGPAAFLIQIGTNLVNDALDYEKGADMDGRLGPRRLTQSGAVGAVMVHVAGILCLVVAMLAAMPAFYIRGKPLVGLVLACCFGGYMYTGGPFPLAYHGLGDVGVLFFFGLLATSGAKYVHQGGRIWGVDTMVAGAQVGLMAVNMLAVNNLRDIETDAQAKKRTIAVRLGYSIGRWQLVVEIVLAYLLGLRWLLCGPPLAFFLPLATVPLSWRIVKQIFDEKPSEKYNGILGSCGVLHLVFSLLLGGSLAGSSRPMI
ncbi:hypothetical protein BSKO_07911 [Bryopsis sp. KO-2023]|nr:hypothetical protein BSKO_07911 [Bryopsis sp. KO-2023]